MEYAIQVENLVKIYNHRITALNGISLAIEKGDVVGYLGPNGAGKTTTIKILTNLIKPTSGHAYINGVDVSKQPKEALQYVGSLIEVPGVYDYLTPHEMLTYFGRVYRMNSRQINQRIDEALELVNLSDKAREKIGSFSTGMQRRLVIAKAVLHSPEILILDEPVLGLDPKGMKDIRRLIRRFHDEGMTVFLSSHLLGEVAETCDKVILLDKGEVITSDSIDNIRNRTEYKVINLKLLNPLSQEDVERIQEIELIDSVEIAEGTVRLHFDGEPATSVQILPRLVSLGLPIVSYNVEGMGLEDFYVSVLGD
ncbi:MAG: ABC transporter ATP-binding protein [Dehalococcoidia bacterium]|nr:ABC transporter ATP-binding protein [Dehalococcoidia bacterium]